MDWRSKRHEPPRTHAARHAFPDMSESNQTTLPKLVSSEVPELPRGNVYRTCDMKSRCRSVSCCLSIDVPGMPSQHLQSKYLILLCDQCPFAVHHMGVYPLLCPDIFNMALLLGNVRTE